MWRGGAPAWGPPRGPPTPRPAPPPPPYRPRHTAPATPPPDAPGTYSVTTARLDGYSPKTFAVPSPDLAASKAAASAGAEPGSVASRFVLDLPAQYEGLATTPVMVASGKMTPNGTIAHHNVAFVSSLRL